MRQLLSHPALYALWQWPFVEQKVAPFRATTTLPPGSRVLDVGCGPGTNARLFAQCDYLGIDLDPGYVERAVARFGRRFRVGDASRLDVADFAPVDCLFVNSLTHHLDDAALDGLLRRTDLVRPGGHLHLIDLHLPASGLPRRLALADRGRHARPLADLRAAIGRHWRVEHEQPFFLRALGFGLWAMVYFRATPGGA